MFCTATFHFNTGSLNKTVVLICAKGKTKSQQLEKEYEEEKRAWKAETDHLLNKQKELMSYLYAGKKRSFPLILRNASDMVHSTVTDVTFIPKCCNSFNSSKL